jgi:NADH-quinone oxidoreductase subunit J
MTTRPELIDIGRGVVPGLIAVGLFVVMAAVFVGANFGTPAAFGDISVVGAIGYSLIGAIEEAGVETESFLAALILLAVALDAALDGALMLAKREGGEE